MVTCGATQHRGRWTYPGDAVHSVAAGADQESSGWPMPTAEIAQRRMAGHVGLVATLVLAALVAVDAPPAFRLVLHIVVA